MNKVEVKIAPDSEGYYLANILDFNYSDNLFLVRFENQFKPDSWVHAHYIRLAGPQSDLDYIPQVDDVAEAQIRLNNDQPYGWWKSDEFNGIVEKEILRRYNKNPFFDTLLSSKDPDQKLVKRTISVSPVLFDWVEETLINLLAECNCLSIYLDKNSATIIIFGTETNTKRAVMLADLHSTHQLEMQQKIIKHQKMAKILQETEKRLTENFIEEFTIGKSLVPLVIGKRGINITNAEKMSGVIAVKVKPDTPFSIVRIIAKTEEDAKNVRKLLEFVEEKLLVQSTDIGWIIGKKGRNIRDLEQKTAGTKIQIIPPTEDEKQASTETNHTIIIQGTRENVTNCKLLLEQHIKYLPQYKDIDSRTKLINNKLTLLSQENGISYKDEVKMNKKYKGTNPKNTNSPKTFNARSDNNTISPLTESSKKDWHFSNQDFPPFQQLNISHTTQHNDNIQLSPPNTININIPLSSTELDNKQILDPSRKDNASNISVTPNIKPRSKKPNSGKPKSSPSDNFQTTPVSSIRTGGNSNATPEEKVKKTSAKSKNIRSTPQKKLTYVKKLDKSI